MSSAREMEWGQPTLAPSNCYGSHDPVSLDDSVVCACCGAEASGGDPDDWPGADQELRCLLRWGE